MGTPTLPGDAIDVGVATVALYARCARSTSMAYSCGFGEGRGGREQKEEREKRDERRHGSNGEREQMH
jgi:hypothetical protein